MFGNVLKIKVILSFLLCFFLVTALSRAGSCALGPQEQVRGSIDAILALLRDEGLSQPGKQKERRDRIFVVVDNRFDFQLMAQLSLSKHWKKLSREERGHFTDLFSRLVVCRYINRIESYTDEAVDYQKEIVQGKKARVYTAILKNSSIPITYSLKISGDKWLVYDVVVEGVSLVGNYRSEFDAILRKNDFNFLMGKVQEKICTLEE